MMVRSTPRKKGVRRTHKQRGGACANPKPNYTLFFAGWGFKANPVDEAVFKSGDPGDAWFTNGFDLVCDTDNNLYTAAQAMNMILKIDQTGKITNFAPYSQPGRLGWGKNGSWPLLVGSTGGTAIAKIEKEGYRASGGVTLGFRDTGYRPVYGNFIALCGDSAENIYFMDWTASCIRKIDTAGIYTVFAGDASLEGDLDGPLTTARFRGLGNTGGSNHMRYDLRTNSIYFYDPGNFKFKKINLATNMVTTLVNLNTNRPRGRVGLIVVHPSADIMYYMTMYCDSGASEANLPTRIYSVDIRPEIIPPYVSKTYAGGGVTTVSGTATATALYNNGMNTMISTVCEFLFNCC